MLSSSSRHCEEQSDEAIQLDERWIASRSLSSGAHSRDPLARNDVESVALRSVWHHVRIDPAARNRRFPNPIAVIAGDHDRVAGRVDAGDDSDMAAAAPAHHRDGANLRPRY